MPAAGDDTAKKMNRRVRRERFGPAFEIQGVAVEASAAGHRLSRGCVHGTRYPSLPPPTDLLFTKDIPPFRRRYRFLSIP